MLHEKPKRLLCRKQNGLLLTPLHHTRRPLRISNPIHTLPNGNGLPAGSNLIKPGQGRYFHIQACRLRSGIRDGKIKVSCSDWQELNRKLAKLVLKQKVQRLWKVASGYIYTELNNKLWFVQTEFCILKRLELKMCYNHQQ